MRYVCVCACERGKEGDQSKQGTASAKALRPEKDSGEQREGHCGQWDGSVPPESAFPVCGTVGPWEQLQAGEEMRP